MVAHAGVMITAGAVKVARGAFVASGTTAVHKHPTD